LKAEPRELGFALTSFPVSAYDLSVWVAPTLGGGDLDHAPLIASTDSGENCDFRFRQR
jgi:hypothetical protein